MPRASSATSTVNKPWVENYPALKEWLNKIGARCLEQVPGPKMAKSKDPTFYIEKWICGAREFYVEVRANQLGWNVYTGCASGLITDTLRDAEQRIGFTPPPFTPPVPVPPVPTIEDGKAIYGAYLASVRTADLSTTEALTEALRVWCLREDRGPISADELILHEDLRMSAYPHPVLGDLSPEQIEWLERFIDRWDEVEKAEAEAKKAGASCT